MLSAFAYCLNTRSAGVSNGQPSLWVVRRPCAELEIRPANLNTLCLDLYFESLFERIGVVWECCRNFCVGYREKGIFLRISVL